VSVDNTVAGYTLLESHEQSPTIAALLTEAGPRRPHIPDIKKEGWRKAIFNCVINPTTSLLGSEVGGIVDPQLNGLKQQIIDECLAVAKADGVTFDEDFVALIDRVFAGARTIASMRQDLMKGRKTEIDHMNGAVVRPRNEIRHRLPGQRGADDDDSLSGNEKTRLIVYASL
jgi:2-dehydropantoate 2-reductase